LNWFLSSLKLSGTCFHVFMNVETTTGLPNKWCAKKVALFLT